MTTPPTPPTDNLAAEGGPRSEMSEREVAAILTRVAAENEINCTGPGEVGCCGRKGWHSWHEHRTHVAESQADALVDLLAARDRRVRGEAWEEGWRAAWSPLAMHSLDDGPNPYHLTDRPSAKEQP